MAYERAMNTGCQHRMHASSRARCIHVASGNACTSWAPDRRAYSIAFIGTYNNLEYIPVMGHMRAHLGLQSIQPAPKHAFSMGWPAHSIRTPCPGLPAQKGGNPPASDDTMGYNTLRRAECSSGSDDGDRGTELDMHREEGEEKNWKKNARQ
ncbi:hypothetical protein B0H10DRAFT_1956383 [Mycena sp. CBHHK59/15]|nr:hypothetical protein B0H10DRAFT_1956383 [Mycena sp. CBHHK59/15]